MEGAPREPVAQGSATCARCGAEWKPAARFCTRCGQPAIIPVGKEDRGYEHDQRDLFIVFGITLAYILGSYFIEREGYRQELAWDAGFFLLICGAAFLFRSTLRPALALRTLSGTKLLGYLGLQAVMTALVIVSANALGSYLGDMDDPLASYRDAPSVLLVALLSIALAPAITEEFAFRGLLFGKLITLTGPRSAIIVSGFLFALVHFSFLSFFWLIPAGLFFGWMRQREGVIWYGVVCHFLHNATVTVGNCYGWF